MLKTVFESDPVTAPGMPSPCSKLFDSSLSLRPVVVLGGGMRPYPALLGPELALSFEDASPGVGFVPARADSTGWLTAPVVPERLTPF